jgi:hypothetical protein
MPKVRNVEKEEAMEE